MAKKPQPLRRYRNFYFEWISRALREAFLGIGFERGAEIMRGLILWAISVLVLYSTDWRGWPIVGTDNPDPGDVVRLGLCAVTAIIIVFGIFFLWHLIVQPVRIYREAWGKIEEGEKLIGAIGDSEADRRFLSEAYAEGIRLYVAKVDNADGVDIWKSNMDKWVKKIEDHLRERWSISAIHEFKNMNAAGGWSTRRGHDDKLESAVDENGFPITARYTAYLQSVDDIIRHGEYAHLGDVQELLLKRDQVRESENADALNSH
jgi:hypothetical protein